MWGIVGEIYGISTGIFLIHACCSTESRREVLLLSDLTETQKFENCCLGIEKLVLCRFLYELE